ncbi:MULTISPECIES: RNA polymerase sporulation sigma factor SigF [unclassified Thermoanaerobacterium]|uniref:RNA polymerase sporulation sigma factor SigF n=1 Tax=unclassified Thermoanaerobacterium TaxID=2622527 RepID=UPI000A150264|nr:MULTISPECIES: RNA polymerase sporulation sigma factor SigF [unclassified Thermoanaerobacterium]MDE4541722.1 RNA polymerase sporulation sigma factor SigF [Thermoanaerobacterium sp. R66]ORX24131.1 RNA polymerase sigma-F factor [Thermoanaerobacterium sp. PSU-2]HHV73709.1 RNA polymerase sporulation sigma factor SigF [Thermoanaerobacterium sp.]
MIDKDNERNEDVNELIRKSKNNDKSSMEKLLKENSGLIWSIVKKFSYRGYEAEDLYQIGCIGFVKAINKFDESYNVKLSTYAVPIIIGEIKRFLRDDGLIKVSRSLKELSNKAYFMKDKLEKELNREPTIQEIASKLNVSAEEVAMAFESTATAEYLYDNSQHNEDDNLLLIEKIGIDEQEYEIEDKLALRMVLKNLNSRERQIIVLRYFKDMTQTEVSKILGISQVQVSRIEKKVLKKLKEQLQEV